MGGNSYEQILKGLTKEIKRLGELSREVQCSPEDRRLALGQKDGLVIALGVVEEAIERERKEKGPL